MWGWGSESTTQELNVAVQQPASIVSTGSTVNPVGELAGS